MNIDSLQQAVADPATRPRVRRRRGQRRIPLTLADLAPVIRRLSGEGLSIPQIYDFVEQHGGKLPWARTTFASICSRYREDIGH